MKCILLLLLLAPRLATAAPTLDQNAIAYQQRLGAKIPLQGMFRDNTGATIRLAELAEGRPMIFILGYFHCPNLCSLSRADLIDALLEAQLSDQRDYALIVVSLNSSETSADAFAAKASDLERRPEARAFRNWQFLTGKDEDVAAVSDALGFHYRADMSGQQFAHPTGVVFATSDGIISSYLLGVGYRAEDVERAVALAARGEVAFPASPVLLLCYDFDPATGRLTLAVVKLLQLVAGVTTFLVATALFVAFRPTRRHS